MKLNKSQLLKVFRKIHKKCNIEKYRLITEAGNINLMYDVKVSNPDKEYIFRGASKKHFSANKFDKECFLHTLITSKVNVKVPKVILYDKSAKAIAFPYLVLEKMEGVMPRDIIKTIPKKERMNIYFELGKSLASIHKIKLSSFGRFYGDKISKYEEKYSKPYSNWKDFYHASYIIAKDKFFKCKRIRFGDISKKEIIELLPHLDKKLREIPKGKRYACIVHDDFYLANMLIGKNKHWHVSAVLDFEMAKAGDPVYEVVLLRYLHDKDLKKFSGKGLSFIKGYNSIHKLPKNLMEIYQIYAPIDMFMELAFSFYSDLRYKGVNKDTKYLFNAIKYTLGMLGKKEFLKQI